MIDTLLIMSLASLIHFNNEIPQPFQEATFEKFEVGRMMEQANRKYVPNKIRLLGGNIFFVLNTVYEQKVNYKLEF